MPSNMDMTRRALLRAGGITGGLAATTSLLAGTAVAAGTAGMATLDSLAESPVSEIETIIKVQGSMSNEVLNLQINRDDIPNVTKDGIPIKPSFEINGNIFFQPGPGGFMMNGDLCFKASEMNRAIDAMTGHGLVWQAQHQHLSGLDPVVWFVHFRGHGSARQIAEGCAAILAATSTPLPQAPPTNPTTPLNVRRLESIIGAPGTVGTDGVVGFQIPRREQISLGGISISPFLNVFTSVGFEPLGGDTAVVIPDFGMVAGEIDNVARVMRRQGWELDCLYNQETDEYPQLYFSHQFKVGNAYQLAAEVRRGLERTNVVLG